MNDAGKELFLRHQRLLLAFFNNPHSRKRVIMPPGYEQEKILSVFPNGFFARKQGKLTGIFYAGNPYLQTLGVALSDVDILKGTRFASSTKQEEMRQLLHYTGVDRDIFRYPLLLHTNFNTGAGDGMVKNLQVQAHTWASTRSDASGTSADYTSTNISAPQGSLNAGNYDIRRVFVPIDTSALGAGAVVASGAFNPNIDSNADNHDTQSICFIKTTQASNTQLVTADFSALTLNSPTEYASRLALAGLSNGFQTIPLTNLALINVSGFSNPGMRLSDDVDNAAPASTNSVTFYCSENGSKIAFLSVTLSPKSGGAFLFNML